MTNQIWLGLLESEKLLRYYSELSDKLGKRNTYFELLLLVPGSGVLAVLIYHFLEGSNQLLALVFISSLVSGIVGWLRVTQYSKKAAIAGVISVQCRALRDDFKRLWYSGEDDTEAFLVLHTRLASVGASLDHNVDKKLSEKTEKEADRHIDAELSAAA